MAANATLTGTQFDALPYEEGRRWELINGELIPVPSATPRHQHIVLKISIAVWRYLEASGTQGLALPAVEFALTSVDRARPDVATLLKEKADRLDRDTTPVARAPDVASH